MRNLGLKSVSLAMVFLAMPWATSAAVVDFNGAMTGSATLAANAACAPIPFRGVISGGLGTSSFGNFTYSHTVCTQGAAGGPITGDYIIDFGIDRFVGTLAGASSPTATVGISNLMMNYSITGGTGRFLGATGGFTATGTADARLRPSTVSLSFAAVPEPGTWAMMLLAFGLLGSAMRSHRRKRAAATFA